MLFVFFLLRRKERKEGQEQVGGAAMPTCAQRGRRQKRYLHASLAVVFTAFAALLALH